MLPGAHSKRFPALRYMQNTRFPYGISNFNTLISEGYYYVDRTFYIAALERLNARYHFFLRPRRFGKSLFVSVLQHYYGREYKADFTRLFGSFYIGQHPTPGANAYIVLKFDFSGVQTDQVDQILEMFTGRVRQNILTALIPHRSRLPQSAISAIEAATTPAAILGTTLQQIAEHCPGEKVYVIVDEYDHFTNEIIAFNFDNFRAIVSQNGFVRKFYEILKEGTQTGIVDRIFVTGVSPVTLDSLTSGFNIAVGLSLDLGLHDLMGFTEPETASLLRAANVPQEQLDRVLSDLRMWYNGYLFNPEAAHSLYNPDMVLYFAMHYARYGKYPDRLLDPNVSSDYGKIRRMFQVGNASENDAILEQIARDGAVQAAITTQFSFEKRWTHDDFISLLFYMGLLTVRKVALSEWVFRVPNHVIAELYYRYFQDILMDRAHLETEDIRMSRRVSALALEDDITQIAEALEMVLQRLSNRDARGLDEKHIKAILMALLAPAGIYGVFSEYPVGQGFADLVLWRRPPLMQPKHQHLIELKYLKKQDAARIEEVIADGRSQLQQYLSHPDISRHGDVLGWLLVVVGYEVVLTACVRTQ